MNSNIRQPWQPLTTTTLLPGENVIYQNTTFMSPEVIAAIRHVVQEELISNDAQINPVVERVMDVIDCYTADEICGLAQSLDVKNPEDIAISAAVSFFEALAKALGYVEPLGK